MIDVYDLFSLARIGTIPVTTLRVSPDFQAIPRKGIKMTMLDILVVQCLLELAPYAREYDVQSKDGFFTLYSDILGSGIETTVLLFKGIPVAHINSHIDKSSQKKTKEKGMCVTILFINDASSPEWLSKLLYLTWNRTPEDWLTITYDIAHDNNSDPGCTEEEDIN